MINVHISTELLGKCAEKYRKIARHRKMDFCPSFQKCLFQWYLMTHGNINRCALNLSFPSQSRKTSNYY